MREEKAGAEARSEPALGELVEEENHNMCGALTLQ